MYRLSVLYGMPTDQKAFDEYYWTKHLNIAKTRNGVQFWSVTVLDPGLNGEPPPYYCVADMYFESRSDLEAMVQSEAGKASREDVTNFATGGVTFLYGEEQVISDLRGGSNRA